MSLVVTNSLTRSVRPAKISAALRFLRVLPSGIMNTMKRVHVANKRRKPGRPSAKAVRRAIASSTAIETGQSIAGIEAVLRKKSSKYRHIELAA
jgi:hypothetical protein